MSSTSSASQPKKKQKVGSSPDISANTSQPTITIDISQTLSLFECCVCLEYINPPILQCPNSHVFCQKCRQKFKSPINCPTCRETLPRKAIRNYSLEQVAESLRLPFPCKYKTYGCDVTSLLTERLNHEKLCNYGPFECPDVSEECDWFGSGDQLAQHLIDEHNYQIDYHSSSQTIDLVDLKLEIKNIFWSSLLNYKKLNFVIIKKHLYDLRIKQYRMKIIVLFIGQQRIADKFIYKADIINESNGKKLQWIDKPISIGSDVKSLLSFRQEDGLILDQRMIDQLSFDNYLKITITIESE